MAVLSRQEQLDFRVLVEGIPPGGECVPLELQKRGYPIRVAPVQAPGQPDEGVKFGSRADRGNVDGAGRRR